MDVVRRIQDAIEPALEDLGFGLVQLLLVGTKRMKLQMIIERLDDEPVSMDDCVKASREISTLLDVLDPLSSAYVLEVSSPGLDRPLVKKEDYHRFQGEHIKLETHVMIDAQRRFKGLLKSVQENEIELEVDDPQRSVFIAFENILKARLDPLQDQNTTKHKRKG